MEYTDKVQVALNLFKNPEFEWRSYTAIMKKTNFTDEEFNKFVSENNIRESTTVNSELGRMFTNTPKQEQELHAGNC